MTKIMLILMLIGSAADMASTEYVLSQGGVENNVLMKSRAVRVTSHIAVPVAAFFLLRNRPVMAKSFVFVFVGAKVGVTARNIYVGVRIRW